MRDHEIIMRRGEGRSPGTMMSMGSRLIPSIMAAGAGAGNNNNNSNAPGNTSSSTPGTTTLVPGISGASIPPNPPLAAAAAAAAVITSNAGDRHGHHHHHHALTTVNNLPVVVTGLPLHGINGGGGGGGGGSNVGGGVEGVAVGLARIKLWEIALEDGVASGVYTRAVESLSASLARNNAAVIELSAEDAALVRCALESAKLYFRSRAQAARGWSSSDWIKRSGYLSAPSRDMYLYRAGRILQPGDTDPPPPCMPEVFRCLGKASRASLSAIARHLRLRSDVFGFLLDDSPLPPGESSSSALTAMAFHAAGPGGKDSGGDSSSLQEVEKGLLMLIASDTPGLQVCDPNGRWYLADNNLDPGDLLLLTGKALQQATAGLRRACVYRVVPVAPTAMPSYLGRTSLAFRLMPRLGVNIDCSAISEAGHVIPEGYGPISVQAFLDNVMASDNSLLNGLDSHHEPAVPSSEPLLRSALSDPLTGALLEDAMAASCGHSYGGGTLQRVYETMVCTSCGAPVDTGSMIQNLAIRAAATAFKREERSRLLLYQGVKRRKDTGEQVDQIRLKRTNKEQPMSPMDKDALPRTGAKGVQYPFSVNERVMIKGNKRTPEKFVGREATITSQCLNGWYLVRTLDNGESVRLQYRSLSKLARDHNAVNNDVQIPGSGQS